MRSSSSKSKSKGNSKSSKKVKARPYGSKPSSSSSLKPTNTKKTRPKLISFDEKDRESFVTGFHERKQIRRKIGAKEQKLKLRKAKLDQRKELQQHKMEYLQSLHPTLFKEGRLIPIVPIAKRDKSTSVPLSSKSLKQDNQSKATVYEHDQYESTVVIS
jgi:hypothetical protein